jgi:hypothetical protein
MYYRQFGMDLNFVYRELIMKNLIPQPLPHLTWGRGAFGLWRFCVDDRVISS